MRHRRSWLRRIARLAKRHGALLIVDDIQAGCGRTGTFFSFEGTGIVPDLVTLSKSLSGFGLPMALLLIRPQHDIWRPAEHNGTFRGNTHAFVTARVALRKFWSDDVFARQVAVKAANVAERLTAMTSLIPGSRVKGRGMMIGIDVGSGELAEAICRRCFEDGLSSRHRGLRRGGQDTRPAHHARRRAGLGAGCSGSRRPRGTRRPLCRRRVSAFPQLKVH